jgi:hypothetical protein
VTLNKAIRIDDFIHCVKISLEKGARLSAGINIELFEQYEKLPHTTQSQEEVCVGNWMDFSHCALCAAVLHDVWCAFLVYMKKTKTVFQK